MSAAATPPASSEESTDASSPATGRIPGNRAIWVGILAELTEFTLMFLVYFFARVNHPQMFHEGPRKLSLLAGSANTLIMVSSSYLVARAVLAMRQDRPEGALRWLLAAFVVGAGYPVVKFLEVLWNLEQGLTGGGDVFQMSYYYLTFNHLVHTGWGLLGMAWVVVRTWMGAYDAKNHNGLVAFASYWHATDLVWLMIFPLFYVMP